MKCKRSVRDIYDKNDKIFYPCYIGKQGNRFLRSDCQQENREQDEETP